MIQTDWKSCSHLLPSACMVHRPKGKIKHCWTYLKPVHLLSAMSSWQRWPFIYWKCFQPEQQETLFLYHSAQLKRIDPIERFLRAFLMSGFGAEPPSASKLFPLAVPESRSSTRRKGVKTVDKFLPLNWKILLLPWLAIPIAKSNKKCHNTAWPPQSKKSQQEGRSIFRRLLEEIVIFGVRRQIWMTTLPQKHWTARCRNNVLPSQPLSLSCPCTLNRSAV